MSQTLHVALSDAEIRRHAAGDVRQLRDRRHPELYFRYSTVDRAKGAWHVVVGGKWGKAGNFPSLSAKTMLGALPSILARRGGDPASSSRVSTWSTVGDLLRWYQDRMVRDRGLSAKRKASALSALKCHLLPRLGDQSLLELDHATLDQVLLWPLQERYALSFVRQVYGVLAVAYRQAARLGLVLSNPMAALKFGDFVQTKIRAKPSRLRGDDLASLLIVFGERFESASAETMLALMMLCHGTRIGETRVARWRHVNLQAQQWFIPAEDTKTKQEHNLPLTAQACALLTRYRAQQKAAGYEGPHLFPGAGRGPISATAATAMFTSLGCGDWTSHDLRKVARTAWTDLGVDYMVGELLLNHAMKDLDQAYIHTTAESLKRKALEQWHEWLDARGFEALHGETCGGCEAPSISAEAADDAACGDSQFPSQRRSQLPSGRTYD